MTWLDKIYWFTKINITYGFKKYNQVNPADVIPCNCFKTILVSLTVILTSLFLAFLIPSHPTHPSDHFFLPY